MGLDRLSGPFGVGASSLRYCKYSKLILNVPRSLPACKSDGPPAFRIFSRDMGLLYFLEV